MMSKQLELLSEDKYITNITLGLITFNCIRIYYKVFNITDLTNVNVCMNFIDYVWGYFVYNFGCDMPYNFASNISSCFIDLNFILGSCVMFMNTRTICEVIGN